MCVIAYLSLLFVLRGALMLNIEIFKIANLRPYMLTGTVHD